nr:hypothetical protein [Paraburkholderia sp. BL10I2N1]
MGNDVAIIGVGLHPFGRFDGVSGRAQGAYAVREALKDANISWDAVQVAYGGSQDAGNADALCNELGLTGLPFVNVANGCATGGSALASVIAAIRSGMAEIGVAVGFDKHPRGAFNPQPRDWGLEDWYGETGLMLTTQFFRAQDAALYVRTRNLGRCPRQRGAASLSQRRAQSECLAASRTGP